MLAVLLCCALAAGPAGAARVLGLFPHPGRSHYMVFEPLMLKLAARGHHVTVASMFPLDHPPPNLLQVTLQGLGEMPEFNIELYDAGVSQRRDLFGFGAVLEERDGFQPLLDLAQDVCRGLVRAPALREAFSKEYDVVIVENFNSDCMLGLAEVYGLRAPKVAVLSSNMMTWSAERVGVYDNPAYVPALTAGLVHPMSLYDRLLNTLRFFYHRSWYERRGQVPEAAVIEKALGKRVDLARLGRNMTLTLVNSHHALFGVRPLVPGLVEVGGMHLNHQSKPLPDYMEQFLAESPEGVVLFSWGSLIKTASIPAEREAVLQRALSALPQRVIWKYEGSGPEGNLTGNILKVNWLPQYDLLRHKKVLAFIAHGGLLGMTEAVSAGKPMLVVPFFGDQPGNAAAAQRAGLATVVRYSELTEESFGQALKKTLSAEMRLQARQLSKMWKDRPMDPLDTAVYWVERVARWGDASALHSPARDLSFIQLALLDVISVILLVVITVCVILFLLVKTILGLLCQSPKAKKKVH